MTRISSRLATSALGLAALGLFPHAASAALSTWSVRPGSVQLQYFSSTTNDWVVANPAPTAIGTPITDGISVTGNGPMSDATTAGVFNLTGAEYTLLNPGAASGPSASPNDRGVRLIAILDGVLNTPYDNSVNRLPSTYDLSWLVSGGTVDLFNVNITHVLLDASDNVLQGVGSSGVTQLYTPGGYETTFAYLDNFGGASANLGTHIVTDFEIGFDWSGFSPNDTIEFGLPNTGVTVSESTLPEPCSLAACALAAVPTLTRRRRRA